ncbi:MAG: helix-turn-helix domain-containing protein [Anaerolineales bacterium]|jgi:excisionase family DNA binding protein
MPDEWLSLGEVAAILGVHPSTVRSWADNGRLPVHRTQGGHRRFRRSEVELCMQSQNADHTLEVDQVVQSALRKTRIQIGEGRLEAEPWYHKLDEEARQQYRQSGRELLQGLMLQLASDDDNPQVEARALGYEYASRGNRRGMSCAEATHAFLFFRNLLLESMFSVYESAAVRSPQVWSDMFRKLQTFTDQILITLLETYEGYQRSNNR